MCFLICPLFGPAPVPSVLRVCQLATAVASESLSWDCGRGWRRSSVMPGCLLEASRGGCPFPRAPFSGWQATVVKGLSFAGTQFF